MSSRFARRKHAICSLFAACAVVKLLSCCFSGTFFVRGRLSHLTGSNRWLKQLHSRRAQGVAVDIRDELDVHEELAGMRKSQQVARRPLSDFSLGERVQGIVTGDSEEGVFVDVGAETDALLKKGSWIGAARPSDTFVEGQQVDVTVMSLAEGQLQLRLFRDNAKRCHTCFEDMSGKKLYGSGGHHSRCMHCCNVGRGIAPFFETGGRRMHCVVGAVPAKVQAKVKRLVKKGNGYWKTWRRTSSRPDQKGRLHGVGLSLSSKVPFPGTMPLKADCTEVLRDLLDTAPVQMLHNASNEDVWSSFRDYVPPPLPSGEPGVAVQDPTDGGVVQAYVGQGYMAVRANASHDHGPPVPVAKLLGVPSCKETCKTCKLRGCMDCEDCCVHVDSDSSASLLLGLQETEPVVDQMAFFVMGNKAFPLAGGRMFLFDGKVVPHGVWCMRGDYIGMAFVRKKPYRKASGDR